VKGISGYGNSIFRIIAVCALLRNSGNLNAATMTKRLPLLTIIGSQWMAILDQLKYDYMYKTEIVAL